MDPSFHLFLPGDDPDIGTMVSRFMWEHGFRFPIRLMVRLPIECWPMLDRHGFARFDAAR
jgi:hypothetical protein